MRSLWRRFKDLRDSDPVYTLLGVQEAIDGRTFLTKSGGLFQMLGVKGVDPECLEAQHLEQICRRFGTAQKGFDERFRVHQYLIRDGATPLLASVCSDPAVQRATTSRADFLSTRALASISVVIAITYEGWQPTEDLKRSTTSWLKNPGVAVRRFFSTRHALKTLDSGLDQARAILTRAVDSFVTQLADVVPMRVLSKQESYTTMRRLANYTPEKVDSVRLVWDDFVDYQLGDSTIECYRDHLRLDHHYVHVLTLKTPPAGTFAHLLGKLQSVPGRLIVTTEWKPESNRVARAAIQSSRRHFHHARTSMVAAATARPQHTSKDMLTDHSAVAVVDELGEALADMEMNGRQFGQFSLTIVLHNENWDELQRAVAECVKVLGTHDAQLIRETGNQLNAWAAIFPGNQLLNVRRLWMSDANCADLAFLYVPAVGEARNSHLDAEYLTVLEGEAGVPYFFNLHHLDNGHTFVIGATGSGKSFFLNLVLTHLQKYGPSTCIFDIGGSYQGISQLFSGSYAKLASGSRTCTINPFCLEPTPENLAFLFAFCKVLIESSGYRMDAVEDRDLAEQIEALYHADPDQRRLLTLSTIVKRSLRLPLQKWTEGGPFGDLFDNVTDTLTCSRFQVFDFAGLDRDPDILQPLLFYVLHRANATIFDPALTASLKVFVMDEAWRFFAHPTIRAYLVEALKTWRKWNAAMLLATQSAEDLRRSEILPVVVESCPTQVFLANPGMDVTAYREMFRLNTVEAEAIANLIPKRQLLLKRPSLSKILNLNVEPVGYWLYTSNPFDIQKRRAAFEQHGFEEGLAILGGKSK